MTPSKCMAEDARLLELVRLFESVEGEESVSAAARQGVELLRELQGKGDWVERAHGRLCGVMVRVCGGREEGVGALLHALGPSAVLTAVHRTIHSAPPPAARWLAGEVKQVLSRGQLVPVLSSQCLSPSSPRLTPSQEHLVTVLCHLPDLIVNKLGRQLDPALLPHPYFSVLGEAVLGCLEEVHSALKASQDCSLVFPATVVGKTALLGQKDTVMSKLVPALEQRVSSDPLWRRLSHTLFARVPSACLEPVLGATLNYASPSLRHPSLLSLLGDLVLTNQRARFLLSHKLVLSRVPPSPSSLFSLVGYLAAIGSLLGRMVQTALEVWGDSSVLRHMDSRQHLWISKVIVLGVVCLKDGDLCTLKPELQRLVMGGVEVHLESVSEAVRGVGMVVGEAVLGRVMGEGPKFQYHLSEEMRELQRLARPVEEQERELEECEEGRVRRGEDAPPSPERLGEGLAHVTECSDNDSDDDDLVPYAMGEDPDASQPLPPRYLRTLLQALLSSSDPVQQESALKTAETLIRSQPSDLSEVCVELSKVLLHLSDRYALPEFVSLRHGALVALAVTCPSFVAPYLTTEFYRPHYTLRQRMEVLDVLSSAAMELATPTATPAPPPPRTTPPCQPWEEVIKERLRAKTRVISKGPSCPPSSPSPNRFAPVAGLFFFPLMVGVDSPLPSLDLTGRDSSLLSLLLHTLGSLMHAATHTPLAPAMAAALMEFLWALRYHTNVSVRQGVLFALGMVVASSPSHTLLPAMEGALAEAALWAREVCENDADSLCRSLAQHALALIDAAAREQAQQQ